MADEKDLTPRQRELGQLLAELLVADIRKFPTAPVAPRLLNLKQAAAYLNVSFWSVRDYVLAGLIPVVQLPALRPREGEKPRQALRRVLVDVQDLDAFIASRKRPPTAP